MNGAVVRHNHAKRAFNCHQMRFLLGGHHLDRAAHGGMVGVAIAQWQQIGFAGVHMPDQARTHLQHSDRVFAVDGQRASVELHPDGRVRDASDHRRSFKTARHEIGTVTSGIGLQANHHTLRSGKLNASKALMVARIPDHKLQLSALEAFTKVDGRGETMSARAALDWLRLNALLKLKGAVFSIKDASLVPKAGACTDCPKRTGASPELFTDIDSPDVCTDPKCYHGKVDAHTTAITETARAKGLEVIEGKEAMELKPANGQDIAGLADVDKTVEVKASEHESAKRVSLRSALTAEELDGKIKAFVDPHTHKVIEVIPKDLEQVARERIRVSTIDHKVIEADEALKQQLKAEAMTLEYHDRWRAAAVAQIEPRVLAGEIERFEAPVLRELLMHLVEGCDYNAVSESLDTPDNDDVESLAHTVRIMDGPLLGISAVRYLLRFERTTDYEWNNGAKVLKLATPVIDSCAQVLGIDLPRTDAGLAFGVVDTPDYRASNPNGLVPLLRDGDFTLWESNAIVRYLCARHSLGNLYPEDLRSRFVAEQWMDWQQTTLNPAGRDAFIQWIRTPASQRNEALIA
eukprot:gene15714-33190_t